MQYQATDHSPARPLIHTLRKGSIIFCQVQDGSFHVQVIRQIISTPAESAPDSGEFRRRFVIGNFDNDDIGYAHVDEVYGRLFKARTVDRGLVGNYGFC